jgi:hypothetical protein
MKPRKAKPKKPKTVEVSADDNDEAIAQKLYDRLKQGLKVKVVIGVGKVPKAVNPTDPRLD